MSKITEEQVRSPDDLRRFCADWGDDLFVFAERDDGPGTAQRQRPVSYSMLSAPEQVAHLNDWLDRGIVPARVRRDNDPFLPLEKEPFVAFTDDELGSSVEPGTLVVCPACGDAHPLAGATDKATGEPSEMMMFYRCGESSYLAALGGQLLPGVEVAAP